MDIEKYNDLQKKLKRKNKRFNSISRIIILILLVPTIIFAVMVKLPMPLIFFILFFELIIFLIISSIIRSFSSGDEIEQLNKLYPKIKEEAVLKFLKKYFTNVTYNSIKGFRASFIREEGLLSTGDRYSSNDSISGTYNNINFCQSDIHIEEERKEEDEEGNVRTYYETIFEGRWMVFDFNKKFKSNLIVESGVFPNLVSNKEYVSVETEDVEFNNIFEVYAEDEHEAFYILTPNFMEKLKKIYEKLQNYGIRLLFNDNKLHIGLNGSDDAFEFLELEEISEEKLKTTMESDIRLIIDFIDELNLTNDLFKR